MRVSETSKLPDAEFAEVSQRSQRKLPEEVMKVFRMHNEPHLQSRMRVGCAAQSGQVACDGRFRARREAHRALTCDRCLSGSGATRNEASFYRTGAKPFSAGSPGKAGGDLTARRSPPACGFATPEAQPTRMRLCHPRSAAHPRAALHTPELPNFS